MNNRQGMKICKLRRQERINHYMIFSFISQRYNVQRERIKESDSSQPSADARFAQASCKELLVPRL